MNPFVYQVVEFGGLFTTEADITDEHVKCTKETLMRKGKLAERWAREHPDQTMKVNKFGAVAQCVFSQILDYFDMLDMMSVPTSHGLLRGVIHDSLL